MYHPSQYRAGRNLTSKDVPDCLWPTDNEYGIPSLRLDLQADAVDLPVIVWGASRRKSRILGSIAFYTDDYRFNALWKDPTPIINSGCVNVVEPNFSVFDQTPLAKVLWETYRKRWLARYWQEHGGVRVFVDLNVAPCYQQYNLLGVPQGWRAFATRGLSENVDLLDEEYQVACERRGRSDVLMLVYGGGREVRAKCLQNQWVWIPEQQRVAHKEMSHDDALTATSFQTPIPTTLQIMMEV
jgi:hypothetical protein